MSYIDVKGLRHKFNIKDKDGNKVGENYAVRDMDFRAGKGQIIAILGRNGSGKSTFAKHLNGLLVPSGGSVYVDGMNPSENDKRMKVRRKVGMVFQNPDNQIVGNTLAEDIGFGLENIGMECDLIWQQIDEMLELIGLSDCKYKNTSHISGGQKQRLAIASTMAMSPECIVLDEATSMLDPKASDAVIRLVLKLNREHGITIIMVTHKLSEAKLANKVYIMEDGTVALEGEPCDILGDIEVLGRYGIAIPLEDRQKNGMVDPVFSHIDEKKYGESAISLSHVSYTYSNGNETTKALCDISLNINQGEIVAVIGETGSGKTTMLQIINRLIRPDGGEVCVLGTNILEKKDIKSVRRRIGYVFQFPECQLFESTVIRDVMYGPLNFKMDRKAARVAAQRALELVGVPEKYYDYSPFDLSGGYKKRVALAGILAYEPDILILDEPACGLDGESRDRLFDVIKKLNSQKGCTIILVSHDMDDVYEMTERVIKLDKGCVVYDGGTKEFFEKEKNSLKITESGK